MWGVSFKIFTHFKGYFSMKFALYVYFFHRFLEFTMLNFDSDKKMGLMKKIPIQAAHSLILVNGSDLREDYFAETKLVPSTPW